MVGFSDIFLFPERIFKKEPDQRMKFRKTNKVGKFEVKKVKKNKGAVRKNVVRACRDLFVGLARDRPAPARPGLKLALTGYGRVRVTCNLRRARAKSGRSHRFLSVAKKLVWCFVERNFHHGLYQGVVRC